MYGPSLETLPMEQSLEVQKIDLQAIEALESKPVSLEQVELEILLSMKIEDGQSFEKAVQSTMVCSGNEFLFSFPSERFPIPCSDVACARLHQRANPDGVCIYLYQEEQAAASRSPILLIWMKSLSSLLNHLSR